jgi:TRAP-type mannitol/chloroaromatic compound transport system substrate-binding protein
MWGNLEQFCDEVRELTGGTLNIELYAAGEIVPLTDALDAVSQGVLEADVCFTNMWAGKLPAIEFLGAYGFADLSGSCLETMMWYAAGDGQKYMDICYDQFGIKCFPLSVAGQEVGGHSSFPITSLDDMVGKRYRMGSGLCQEVAKRVGIDPFWCAVSEGYTALDRGLVDILKMGHIGENWGHGYQEVPTHAFWPGWTKVGDCCTFEINKDAWNALTAQEQKAVQVATQAASWRQIGLDCRDQAVSFQKYVDYGIIMTKLDNESVIKLMEETKKLVEERCDADPLVKEIHYNRQNFANDWRALGAYTTHSQEVLERAYLTD